MNTSYKTIEIKNKLPKPNTLNTDYRVEVAALNLLKYYNEIDHIYINRLGSNNKSFNKDIENIQSEINHLGDIVVSIDTYREGIYDYLPEGLFHPLSLGGKKSNIDSIIKQIQKQKKVEADARKFFQPFEMEAYYLVIQALVKENEFEITDRSRSLLNIISELWTLLKELDQDSAETFIYLLPFFHAERGNKNWFAKCLSAFLRIPVEITFTPNRVEPISNSEEDIRLSNFILGQSTVVSGSHLDGLRNWAINYGPIPYDKVENYIPQSKLRKILKRLYDYCLPSNVEAVENFIIKKNKKSFTINLEKNTNRLGYSTFL